MRPAPLIVIIALLLQFCEGPPQNNEPLVELKDYNGNIVMDIRYATTNNFLHEQVYPEARCFVRERVAVKLDSIQQELEQQGLGLKVFDGYRPLAVQYKMWEILPDDRYVADPKYGSLHNRGAAVDVSLVDSTGKELPMPTDYDDFTEKAYHSFNDLPAEVLENRKLLETIMDKYGFVSLETEWWHYHIKNYRQYPIMDISFREIKEQKKPLN